MNNHDVMNSITLIIGDSVMAWFSHRNTQNTKFTVFYLHAT